jgi:two-component system CheB/CheR fusion protein
MCVEDGRLMLKPRPTGVHAMAVNCFLNSLAEDRGNAGIAVILSGTASDGVIGVKAIKAEGGLVFAQDEASAGHSGMPRSAAATGAVDFVLPPEGIAAELSRVSAHPVLSPDVARIFADTDSLGRIFESLRRATGVDFAHYKASTVRRRVLRRLMVHKLERLDQYLAKLKGDADEARALHDDLLIHVTQFFREPAVHHLLTAKVFPRLVKSLPRDATLRVWVPGCSTGEEAYSLLISLLDFLGERDSLSPVQVFATDISESALEKARAGVYPEEIQSQMPARLLRRFFRKVEGGYEVAKRLREMCVFARHDLTKDPPFANLDLVSCCNVLIYLDQTVQRTIFPVFHYALRPSGVLILGAAESVGEFSSLFAAIDKKSRVYYKKPAPSRVAFAAATQRAAAGARAAHKPPASAHDWETDVQKAAERILLSRYAPAGVVVGEDLGILHFRGRVSRYLEPATGKASLSLLKMVPAHAAGELKSLLQKARRSETSARLSGLELGGEEGAPRRVSVEAIPFRLPLSGDRYCIVVFEEGDEAAAPSRRPAASGARESSSVRRLKTEIGSLRSYLQTNVEEHEAATEELRSANEEIISSNEELQSTNEELEIAKEELQAANEELSTLNEELQNRNSELALANNDLQNLLASVHLPIVMVTTDLRIRRFTPMAERVMNLIPTDVGRPIGDIKPKLDLPNIEEVLLEVMETVTAKELELEDREGRSYLVRVRPYRTTENRIEGAVIVFVDNEPLRRSTSEVKAVSAFEAVLDMAGEPLAVLDAKLRVRAVGRSMYQAFGLSKDVAGRSLFELEGGRWNEPSLRQALERLVARGEPFTDLRVRVADRDLAFSARRVEPSDSGEPLVLIAIGGARAARP